MSKIKHIEDVETGWSFDILIDEDDENKSSNGLILKNIYHSDHKFAHEIRILGFWLGYFENVSEDEEKELYKEKLPEKFQFFELNKNFFSISDIEILEPEKRQIPFFGTYSFFSHAKEASFFSHYPFYFGIRINYQAKAEFFDNFSNPDNIQLTITQTFLFSKYDSEPSHEPTGGLSAARIHPLVKTEFGDSKEEVGFPKTVFNSIRFDYYLYLQLDNFLYVDLANTLRSFGFNIPNQKVLGNYAGLFKDEEMGDIGAAIWALIPFNDDDPVSQGIFSAVEKPIVLEVCASGLEKGLPFKGQDSSPIITWDNIHWWSAKKNGEHISAPGGFHAAHLHWRWGGAVLLVVDEDKDTQFSKSGVPDKVLNHEFNKGIHWLKHGALVDPNCWIQTIQFAIVHYDVLKDPSNPSVDLSNISTEKFKDLFIGSNIYPPQKIPLSEFNEGGDLVLWYSIKINKYRVIPATKGHIADPYGYYSYEDPTLFAFGSLNGTIFIHGIFFPHGVEKTGFQIGPTYEEYFPKSKKEIEKNQEWERY